MHGSKEIILPVVKHIVVHGHAGGNQLGYPPFHQFFRQLRILKLFADGHTLPCAH